MSTSGGTAARQVDELLESAFKDIGIPPRPMALERINAEMQREEPDMQRLASIISSDVSLAAGLMKSANSAFMGGSGRARNVDQALVFLGLDISARAITGLILRNTFPRIASLERFWDSSARIAQLAGWMCGKLRPPGELTPGDAYSFGLFRDCGIAVMMRKFRDYGETLKLANNSKEQGFTDIENARHPTNHAMVGCLLARTWSLPEVSCTAIRHHHDVPAIEAGSIALPEASASLIALAQFSEYIVQRASGLSHTCEWDKMRPICRRILGLDEAGEASIIDEAMPIANAE